MKKTKSKPSDCLIFFVIGLLVGGALIYVYYNSNSSMGVQNNSDLAEAAAYLKFKEIRTSVTPSGVPGIYGNELDLSFDRVQESIDIMTPYGPTFGREGQKIVLTGSDLERYKNIGVSISCEYCCGVESLTREDGVAACGCAHSIMMRALAAYLIQNHPNEFTDEEILEELVKWKMVFFPKQTLVARLQELEKTGEPGIKEILEEFPEFMPSMVGGC
jgi:hypothetical protein